MTMALSCSQCGLFAHSMVWLPVGPAARYCHRCWRQGCYCQDGYYWSVRTSWMSTRLWQRLQTRNRSGKRPPLYSDRSSSSRKRTACATVTVSHTTITATIDKCRTDCSTTTCRRTLVRTDFARLRHRRIRTPNGRIPTSIG